MGTQEQVQEQATWREDGPCDDLREDDTTSADDVDSVKRDQLVTDALRFERSLRGRLTPDSHYYTRLQPSRNEYWLANYRLLQWRDDSIPEIDKILGIHKKRAGIFIGRRKTQAWRRKHRWMRMDTKSYLLGLSVLVGSLARSARHALTVLHALPDRRSHFFLRADALFKLRYASWKEIKATLTLTARFWYQVALLRDVTCWPAEPIRTRHLDLMLQNIPEEEQRRVLLAFLNRYDHLDDMRLLYLVDCYTRLKDVDTALSILRRVSPAVLQQKSGKAAPRCTNLLKLESVQRNGDSHSFRVLPAILELGIPPDDIIYNFITAKSVKFELPAVAWDIFRHAKKEGAALLPGTHLILLKDSYLRRDASNLNEMLSIIQRSSELYQYPPINAYMINIIRGICMYEMRSGAQESLARMLAVYDKAYNRTSLAIAGIIAHDQVDQGSPTLPRPEGLSLAFMIFSYTMIQTDLRLVSRFWRRLVHKVERGNPDLVEAAKYAVLYDGFICFYSKNERNISQALNVFRFMLANERCTPGDITWSLLIKMFLRHNKHGSAEKIRLLMLERRVPVTEEAWRHVLLAYPYTEIAQEVQRILGRGKAAETQNPRTGEIGGGSESENLDDVEGSIDVTAEQALRIDNDNSTSESTANPAWTSLEGLDSVLNLAEKKVCA